MSARAPSALALIAAVAIASALPARARAYIDFGGYAADAEEGGGGGRYFTGSMRDGLTCSVCHRGGSAPAITVDGLPGPSSGYVPGRAYDISLTWDAAPASSSAMIELSTWWGAPAGTVGTIDDRALTPAERCADGHAATAQVSLPDGRSLVYTETCRVSRARFRWTAPADPSTGPVWLTGAIVRGNEDASPGGDGAASIARLVPVVDRPVETAVVASDCGVATRGTTAPAPLEPIAILLFAAVLIRARRRRTKRKRWAARALALAAALVATLYGARSIADDVGAAVTVWNDSDRTTVVTPRARVRAALVDDRTHVEASYAADIWTSASIDIRTAASKRITEQRDEIGVAFDRELDDVTLRASYRFSHELDYVSHSGGASASVDLAGGASTLDGRVGLEHDFIGRAGDPQLSEEQTAIDGRATYTQILDASTVLQLVYQLIHAGGFQSSPYRWVGIGGDGSCAGTAISCVPETHPDERWRQAVGAMARRSLGARTSAGLEYRLYADSWGLVGHTAQANGSWLPDDDTVVTLRYRLHRQSAASFYRGYYGPETLDEQPFFTRDRELGAMTSHRVALSVERELDVTSAGPTVRIGGALGGMLLSYDDFPGLERTWALDATLSMTWEL